MSVKNQNKMANRDAHFEPSLQNLQCLQIFVLVCRAERVKNRSPNFLKRVRYMYQGGKSVVNLDSVWKNGVKSLNCINSASSDMLHACRKIYYFITYPLVRYGFEHISFLQYDQALHCLPLNQQVVSKGNQLDLINTDLINILLFSFFCLSLFPKANF